VWGERDRDVAVVAAFLEGDRKGLVAVEGVQMTPQARIHNFGVVEEERLVYRADPKEDAGIDQGQVTELDLKVVRVEVRTGLVQVLVAAKKPDPAEMIGYEEA
jgi:hypothetical protein